MPSAKNQKSQPILAPARVSTPTTDPPNIVSSEAESNFRTVRSRLLAFRQEALVHVNVDLQIAAVFALGVSRQITEPAVRARFARLATTGEFEDACVDDLSVVAQAAWYARHRFLLASATHSDARVSLELLDEATALRTRMLKVADYWLSDDATLAAELTVIRAGTGYQDLANDLIALGAMFDRNAATLAQDRKLHQATDAATASRLSGLILEQLGAAATEEQNEWSAMQPRVWTLLLETYSEVQRGGQFLFARDRAAERFPSLAAVGRSPARSTREPAADATPTPAAADSADSATPPAPLTPPR